MALHCAGYVKRRLDPRIWALIINVPQHRLHYI